jgi:exonuclease III
MEYNAPPLDAFRGRDQSSESAPDLNDYRLSHPARRYREDFNRHRTCTRLILYNVQSFTVPQIWTELRASLGELARSIVKVKRVSGLNRKPHADLWVRKDSGAALVDVIRRQTRTRLWNVSKIVTEAERLHRTTFPSLDRRGPELRKSEVLQWRIALWQPWRERRMEPARNNPPIVRKSLPTGLATWNINGFWSKKVQVVDLLYKERVAVLAIQETLVSKGHYPISLDGYRCYSVTAEEGFRGTAILVNNGYASYEVPHGLRWLTHVKVFGYAGESGPTHFIGVYLKSGGNYRLERREAFTTIAKLTSDILNRKAGSRVIVLGDLNMTRNEVHKSLTRAHCPSLDVTHIRGSPWSRFPINGTPRDLDHILMTRKTESFFLGGRVLRQYNASDHRPVAIYPRTQLPPAINVKPKVKFDNNMIRLKSDLVVNDNAWSQLMTRAFGEDYLPNEDPERDQEVSESIANNTSTFIKTFDRVCRKHSVKKEVQLETRRGLPRKLKTLLLSVKRYSNRVAKAALKELEPEGIDITRLASAQRRFKQAKRVWEIRKKQEFYSKVADDLVTHDHKGVWNRLDSHVKPKTATTTISPVMDKEGVVQFRPEKILEVFKEHYEDLLTYDPDELSHNWAHWDEFYLGDPLPMLEGLNDGLLWPEILITIRGINRNTAPGEDGVHINVLKAMVLEECMAQVQVENPQFNRPDNVRIDLEAASLPKSPLTKLGKAFYALLNSVWQSYVIPAPWQRTHIINLFKGGDPENTQNYRGISLISCAYKVLMAIMATRLSTACVEGGRLSKEQAGFRKREEAVAQAIALAELIRRRWLKGKPTFGLFIDFKKAYDRLYHGLMFRVLDHIGVRGRFLDMVKAMYLNVQCAVRIGDLLSESFSPVRGAKQGDPLSPILFIITINSVLKDSSAIGGVRATPLETRCPGLMYADDVIALESRLTDLQETLARVWMWGRLHGMELGREKCGVLLWPSSRPRVLRRKLITDYESDCSSIIGIDDWGGYNMEDIEYQHELHEYTVPGGEIPTVTHYKYLGIMLDSRLGNPRNIVTGERSMELEFAHTQAKKGMNILFALRPFLTDRFCPIAVKVMIVRNLVYSKMLYGAEFIGFQALHAAPMQRIINVAAKWILGLSKDASHVDAFTLCYELGLPPIHQELCAMRARLCYKLEAHTDGGLNTWIQDLWDQPPSRKDTGPRLTWVTASRRWLKELDKDKNKYNRLLVDDAGVVDNREGPLLDAPLRPWAQLGRSAELKVRSTPYSLNPTGIQAQIRIAFLGEDTFGEMPSNTAEAPIDLPVNGLFEAVNFDFDVERELMDRGRIVPSGRDRGQVVKTSLVRDVVLERMMTSQRTKGFEFYDRFHFGITRGYLREAPNRPDLAEGVRWLSLIRAHGFPTIEGTWQRIKRSGREPPFQRGKCPICSGLVKPGWEWSHLLVICPHDRVVDLRRGHLESHYRYLVTQLSARGADWVFDFSEHAGRENEIQPHRPEVVSIYLVGGLYRSSDALGREQWFDTYQIGFGHLRIVTPPLETFSYVPVASFLQSVVPLYLTALGGDPYGVLSSDDDLTVSSRDDSVNQNPMGDRVPLEGNLDDAHYAPDDPEEPVPPGY